MAVHRAPPALALVLVLPAALGAAPAWAAGNGHVVDDAAVTDPGTCAIESWVTRSSGDTGVLNVAPICTRAAWPNLELAGFVAHGWEPGGSETVIGISPKLKLRDESRGLGLGLLATAGYSIDRAKVTGVSLIGLATLPLGSRLRVHLNGGWQYFRLARNTDLFVGAQAELAVTKRLTLMVEGFTRDREKPGGQIGVRWARPDGRFDIDLMAGRYLDGVTRDAVTLGVTLRR